MEHLIALLWITLRQPDVSSMSALTTANANGDGADEQRPFSLASSPTATFQEQHNDVLDRNNNDGENGSAPLNDPTKDFVSSDAICALLDSAKVARIDQAIKRKLSSVRRRPTKLRTTADITRFLVAVLDASLHHAVNLPAETDQEQERKLTEARDLAQQAKQRFLDRGVEFVTTMLMTSTDSLLRVALFGAFARGVSANSSSIEQLASSTIPRSRAINEFVSCLGNSNGNSNAEDTARFKDSVTRCFPASLSLPDFEELALQLFGGASPFVVNALFRDKSVSEPAAAALAAFSEVRHLRVQYEIKHVFDLIAPPTRLGAAVKTGFKHELLQNSQDEEIIKTLAWAVRLMSHILLSSSSSSSREATLAGIRLFTQSSRDTALLWLQGCVDNVINDIDNGLRSLSNPPAAANTTAALEASLGLITLLVTSSTLHPQAFSSSGNNVACALSRACLLQCERLCIANGISWPPRVQRGAAAAVCQQQQEEAQHAVFLFSSSSTPENKERRQQNNVSPSRRVVESRATVQLTQQEQEVEDERRRKREAAAAEAEAKRQEALEKQQSDNPRHKVNRLFEATQQRLRTRLHHRVVAAQLEEANRREQEQQQGTEGSIRGNSNNNNNSNFALSRSVLDIDANAKCFVVITLCGCKNAVQAARRVRSSSKTDIDSSNRNRNGGSSFTFVASVANTKGLSVLTTSPAQAHSLEEDYVEFGSGATAVVPFKPSETYALRVAEVPSSAHHTPIVVARRTWQLPSEIPQQDTRTVIKLDVNSTSEQQQEIAAAATGGVFLGVDLAFMWEAIPFYPSRADQCWLMLVFEEIALVSHNSQATTSGFGAASETPATGGSLTPAASISVGLSPADASLLLAGSSPSASSMVFGSDFPANEEEIVEKYGEDAVPPLLSILTAGFGDVALRLLGSDGDFPLGSVGAASVSQQRRAIRFDAASATIAFPMKFQLGADDDGGVVRGSRGEISIQAVDSASGDVVGQFFFNVVDLAKKRGGSATAAFPVDELTGERRKVGAEIPFAATLRVKAVPLVGRDFSASSVRIDDDAMPSKNNNGSSSGANEEVEEL